MLRSPYNKDPNILVACTGSEFEKYPSCSSLFARAEVGDRGWWKGCTLQPGGVVPSDSLNSYRLSSCQPGVEKAIP